MLRKAIIPVLVIAALLATACGASSAPTPTPVPPTLTPVPPTPTPAVDLPQSISNETSGLSIRYPDGWSGQVDEGTINLFYDASEPTEGESLERVFALVERVTAEQVEELEISAEAPVSDIVAAMAEQSSNSSTSFGEVSTFDANGREAAFVSGTLQREDQAIGIRLMLIDLGDELVMIMLSGTDGIMADIEPTLLAMAASLTAEPS